MTKEETETTSLEVQTWRTEKASLSEILRPTYLSLHLIASSFRQNCPRSGVLLGQRHLHASQQITSIHRRSCSATIFLRLSGHVNSCHRHVGLSPLGSWMAEVGKEGWYEPWEEVLVDEEVG
ncbi:hypothetical protein SCHPADRAFT_672118 [Schizopora paradoxa]|uniref:Uncharacterized protein n=1 Tax=Schizopora paradoxa TaxID=27342 RepID=A0A0H2R539_9AGAM|nr:hypothetical protein SCHPADRAFT_672118 [Schizopora paradoxa]